MFIVIFLANPILENAINKIFHQAKADKKRKVSSPFQTADLQSYSGSSEKKTTQQEDAGYNINELLNDLGIEWDESKVHNQVVNTNDEDNPFPNKTLSFLKKLRDDLQGFYEEITNYQ